MARLQFLFGVVLATSGLSSVHAREWTDATGVFGVEAELVDFDDDQVVLQKPDRQLLSVPLAQLSKADREYLKSKEATSAVEKLTAQPQTWTLRNGTKLVGKVVDFAKKEITLERRRGQLFVNDQRFDNLPQLYRETIPQIVAHHDKIAIDSARAFNDWVLKQKGVPRTFTCQGVMLELENGDEYGVPFFLFSDDDRKLLEPGWKQWMAAREDDAMQDQMAFRLEQQAEAYQRDREANQQMAMMQLGLLAVAAGVTDLWEVSLAPARGASGSNMFVVVPARNSAQAVMLALQQNPNYVAVLTPRRSQVRVLCRPLEACKVHGSSACERGQDCRELMATMAANRN